MIIRRVPDNGQQAWHPVGPVGGEVAEGQIGGGITGGVVTAIHEPLDAPEAVGIANELDAGGDVTVGKVSIWAEENNFSVVVFLNLFAYVSSRTAGLVGKTYQQLVGQKNDDVLTNHIKNSITVVLGWGGDLPVPDSIYNRRLVEIKRILDQAGVIPNHVGALSSGKYPRHGRSWNKANRKLSPLEWEAITRWS